MATTEGETTQVEAGQPEADASTDSLASDFKKVTIKTNLLEKFEELVAKDVDAQMEFFLKSFIFALGDDWTEVNALATKFKDYLRALNESSTLNAAQAADFLQKQGRTRTAEQRRKELRDIDLDNNDRIGFVEYLLLHYKAMVLREYYKRHEKTPPFDVSSERAVIGLTGVGNELVEELFAMPHGLDPALEEAIENFTKEKKARAAKIEDLEAKAALGGVKGMTAKNELAQMHAQDQTAMNRMEATLNAAKRKAAKKSGEMALESKKKKQEEEEKRAREESKARLKARAALWEQQIAKTA